MDVRGCPRGLNWLALTPSGPHMAGARPRELARNGGGILFTIDMDPRWVKKCIAEGQREEAGRYVDHLIKQAGFLLKTQDIGVIVTTPPLLERLAQHDVLVKLVNEKVRLIQWAGAHMDVDTRHLLRTDVFPGVQLQGLLLPNNLERDTAIRMEPPAGQLGDSVADVSPVASFDNQLVIEGVY